MEIFEKLIIAGLFGGAIYFLFKQFKASFSAEGSACAKNCGGACGVDLTSKLVEKESNLTSS